MAALPLTFGSYVYFDNGAFVETYDTEGTVREAVAAVPRSDVAKAQRGYKAPRTISLQGTLSATTYDLLKSAVTAFEEAHAPDFRPFYDPSGRYVMAETRSLSISFNNTYPTSAKFTVKLQAPAPDWISP